MKMSALPVIRLLRPEQWLKNGFVFLPMFFSGNLLNMWCLQQSLVVFCVFSLMASAVYCINDIVDVEADRNHPEKCRRPLASGSVTRQAAGAVAGVLVVSAVSLCLLCCDAATTVVAVSYLVLNMLYSVWLKNHAIVDVFTVAFGFVLRLFAGGFACAVELSPWIVLLTFLLSLFLAIAKRRDDVVILQNTGLTSRRSVRRYNLQFLDQMLGIVGAMTMICYIMYTVSAEVVARLNFQYVYVSAVFVLAGILRYLQLAIVDNRSGSPTGILMRDRFIQAAIACWLLFFLIVLYI